MADAASALRRDSDLRGKVDVVFVTTDPRRDTRSVMRRWLDRFDDSFIGLTGTPQQLVAAQQAAHIQPATDKPGGPNGYEVTHTSLLLGYGANDQAQVVYAPGAKVSDIASDLHLLAEKDPPT
jgi:protein SCO1/2